MPDKMKSVLFVCTANRYRSPFAAAVFEKELKSDGVDDGWRVGSAGTWTQVDLPVIPHAFQKAQEFGLDLQKHRSIEINSRILSEYKLIVVMETGHKEAIRTEFPETSGRIFLLSEIVDQITYDILDPAKNMDDADEIISELYTLVQRGYPAICALVNEML